MPDTHTHIYTHTYTHTYTHRHTQMFKRMHVHARMHNHTQTRAHTHTHTHYRFRISRFKYDPVPGVDGALVTFKLLPPSKRLQVHTHTYTYTHTHTHIHTHDYMSMDTVCVISTLKPLPPSEALAKPSLQRLYKGTAHSQAHLTSPYLMQCKGVALLHAACE